MPRFSDEEDSSSSDSASDSDASSVHSIPDNVPTGSKQNPSVLAGGYSTEYFVTGESHVSSRLVDNRAKRKLRSRGSDGRVAKTRRLESHDLKLTRHELDALEQQDLDDSDYETAEEDEEDEEDEEEGEPDDDDELPELRPESSEIRRPQAIQAQPHLGPAVQQPSIRAHPAWPQQQSSRPQAQQQSIQPGTKRMTVFELMCQKFPKLGVSIEDVPRKLRFLTELPVRQVPIVASYFHLHKPQNTVSYLIQASGELLPEKASCESCRTATRGIYQGCVVARDPLIIEALSGSCACCWYGRQGFKCSFRHGETPPITGLGNEGPSQSQTPVPIPRPPPLPYKQLQRESEAFQQKRVVTPATQVRPIPQGTHKPSPPQNTSENGGRRGSGNGIGNGNGNGNGTAPVRKETPVLPPTYNNHSITRRRDENSTQSPQPAVPKDESRTLRGTGGTGSSTGTQNHFAGLAVELPKFVTQIQQFNNREKAEKEKMPNGDSSSAVSDSIHTTVDKWTAAYERMGTQQLLAAHKELVTRITESNARLAAMMNVLIKKCGRDEVPN